MQHLDDISFFFLFYYFVLLQKNIVLIKQSVLFFFLQNLKDEVGAFSSQTEEAPERAKRL